ncbi:Ima1 amino-terminal domain protein [Ceratobasidium sp. AG-Ba]|nr:Ima1 amino-terminal domain protein [Ceratobasidium sp. AG-Ba]
MFDESYNADSFSKRASPNKNRLPSSFPSTIFCHTCQTNQTLIVNMLSNYLPPSSDPSYTKLLAEYPAYKASLHARYPPVCAKCQPIVDERIEQKDSMARSSALGGWLEASNRRGRSSSADPGAPSSHTSARSNRGQIVVWNVRGVLWACTLAWWVYVGVASSITYPTSPPGPLGLNIWLMLLSILWQFWDPTWRTLQRAQFQGRDVRVEGRKTWVRYQGFIWIARLALCIAMLLAQVPRAAFIAAGVLEIIVNLAAFRNIRIIRPPRIRLVASSRPATHAVPAIDTTFDPPPQQAPEVPALSALSLSPARTSRPERTVNPIFGVTSLNQPASIFQPHAFSKEHDPDAMDWTPTAESARQEPTEWIRPARFAPEKPTGLEGLLEKFGITGDDVQKAETSSGPVRDNTAVGRGIVIGIIVGVLAVGLCVWPSIGVP